MREYFFIHKAFFKERIFLCCFKKEDMYLKYLKNIQASFVMEKKEKRRVQLEKKIYPDNDCYVKSASHKTKRTNFL